jgi:uncharacterized phage-like protein YoqJ
MIVAITGHRPDKLGGYGPSAMQEWVRKKLRENLRELGTTRLYTGMALGVDTWAAQIAIEEKIPFVAALPFPNQGQHWPFESHMRHRELLLRAAEVVCVSSGPYSPKKMQLRNEYMVDCADCVLGVYDGSSGGTANCLEYARRRGKNTIIINPRAAT